MRAKRSVLLVLDSRDLCVDTPSSGEGPIRPIGRTSENKRAEKIWLVSYYCEGYKIVEEGPFCSTKRFHETGNVQGHEERASGERPVYSASDRDLSVFTLHEDMHLSLHINITPPAFQIFYDISRLAVTLLRHFLNRLKSTIRSLVQTYQDKASIFSTDHYHLRLHYTLLLRAMS